MRLHTDDKPQPRRRYFWSNDLPYYHLNGRDQRKNKFPIQKWNQKPPYHTDMTVKVLPSFSSSPWCVTLYHFLLHVCFHYILLNGVVLKKWVVIWASQNKPSPLGHSQCESQIAFLGNCCQNQTKMAPFWFYLIQKCFQKDLVFFITALCFIFMECNYLH